MINLFYFHFSKFLNDKVLLLINSWNCRGKGNTQNKYKSDWCKTCCIEDLLTRILWGFTQCIYGLSLVFLWKVKIERTIEVKKNESFLKLCAILSCQSSPVEYQSYICCWLLVNELLKSKRRSSVCELHYCFLKALLFYVNCAMSGDRTNSWN